MLKRVILTLLTIIAVGCVGYIAGRWVFIRAFASTDLQLKPYVAQIEHFTLGAGNGGVVSTELVVRRRDGATLRSFTLFKSDGTSVPAKRVDFPDGYTGMIIDSIRAKATGVNDARTISSRKYSVMNPPAQCLYNGEVLDGQEALFGHTAFRIIRQARPDQRDVVWRFPEYSCAVLQVFHQTLGGDSAWQVIGGLRLVALVETDPDPRAFTNWSDYEEMKPSDMKRKLLRNSGVTPEKCKECFSDDPSDNGYLALPRPSGPHN